MDGRNHGGQLDHAHVSQDPSLMSRRRACDRCRSRKVRCDAAAPCSGCKTAGVLCQTTARSATPRRAATNATTQYQAKIDQLEARLQELSKSDADLRNRLEGSLSTTESELSVPLIHSVPHADYSHPNLVQNVAPAIRPPWNTNPNTTQFSSEADTPASVPNNLQSFEESQVHAGETSMKAHVTYACNILQNAIKDVPLAADNTFMASAVAMLQQLNAHPTTKGSDMADKSLHKFPAKELRETPLPPAGDVLEILRRCAGTTTFLLSSPLGFLTLAELNEVCKEVYFPIEPSPLSRLILFHGHMHYLFQEFLYRADHQSEREKWSRLAESTLASLEAYLSSIPIASKGTRENVMMFLFSTAHAIQTSRPGLASRLISSAAEMCLSLGWHRNACYAKDCAKERNDKLVVFWNVYILDKGLSIRLGRASSIQDYDVDVDTPNLGHSPRQALDSKLLASWVQAARVQGQTYQRLYSPASLHKPPGCPGDLLNQTRALQSELLELNKLESEMSSSNLDPKMGSTLNLLRSSDLVSTYMLSTMIYRALDKQEECLASARKGMDLHLKAASDFRNVEPVYWTVYFTWTFLQLPFLSFIVIFYHVLATSDHDDLGRLKNFTKTMTGLDSLGLQKLRLLCQTFCEIADLYIEARKTTRLLNESTQPISSSTSSSRNNHASSSNRPNNDMSDGIPRNVLENSYIGHTAFQPSNFAPYFDPSLRALTMEQGDLATWYYEQQFLTGLLDE